MFNNLHVAGRSLLTAVVFLMLTSQVQAAAETGEYLKYQEPQATTSSWLSTGGYILSLILTFLLVLALAYLTSRFLGQKIGQGRGYGTGKVYATLALGPNRAVYVVEMAGKFMVLGVTEQSITLLNEITSPSEIEQLKAAQNNPAMPPEQFSYVFSRQLQSLKQLQKDFQFAFHTDNRESHVKEQETDIRKR